MKIIETRSFSRIRRSYFDEDSFMLLAYTLGKRPLIGPVIPGPRGVRKLRWRLPGRGKRGGLRVVYHVAAAHESIYLLTAYAKNEIDELPRALLRKMREAIEHE